ncbi:hypothetical protein AAEX28_02175 [Lentisphaerota bacterium WC36G]|nr:hypothetical protein LJT99_05060 [Lentisphaerae bacterium WC36]
MKRYLIFTLSVVTATNIFAYSKNAKIINDQEKAISLLKSENVSDIIFARRTPAIGGHWYENFGYYYNNEKNIITGKNGALIKFNINNKKLTSLINDKNGAVRDPQLHYDAKKLIFSYRKGNSHQYHLYEIDIDGKNLHQLTDGIFDDIEPTYMPNNRIAFISSRTKKWVPCWYSHVATLYSADADGKDIKKLSANTEHDNTPQMLPDGRILFTRWEYVDRSQMLFHHLWTMNPDGTNVEAFFGNMHGGGVFIDAKAIPNKNEVVFTRSPYHGRREHVGDIFTVSSTTDPDNQAAAKMLLKGYFRDPYPVSDKCFLVASGYGLGVTHKDYPNQLFLLFNDKNPLTYHEPLVVRKRKREIVIPQRADYSKDFGTLILTNVNIGRNMKGVKPGEITKLLVVEQLPKPVTFGKEQTHDFVPISWGGTHFMERILGTVPVEKDGSAFFKLPANRALFFIALDKNNQSVKRMHSFLSVMPGETISCVGCHEKRTQSPPLTRRRLMAVSRPPSEIKPLKYNRYVYDYPRDIQPILDKNCVSCHNSEKPSGRVNLSGDNGVVFSQSYFTMIARGLVSDGRNGRGNSAPRTVGDVASPIMQIINSNHHDINLSEEEKEHIRNWINVGAFYPGTYAALGQGMMIGKQRSPEFFRTKKVAAEVLNRRCISCHENQLPLMDERQGKRFIGWDQPIRPKKGAVLYEAHSLYNLTTPEHSNILLASLAKRAGGWAEGTAEGVKKSK